MNVTLEKTDNVNAVIAISFEENDYQADVKKQLNELGRKRPLKGFRPGHVPAAMLKKIYGPSVMADVIDRRLSKELTNYILDNKLNVLGEPMLSKDTNVDLNTQKEFTFKFDLGLAPDINLTLDKNVKIPYYNIEVSQDMLDKQNEAYRKRFGTQVPGEASEEDSMLHGNLIELDENGAEKADGIKVEKAVIGPRFLKDEDEKKKFVGKKVGEEIVYNPFKSVDGNLSELSALLNVDRDKAEVKSDFKFEVTEILVNKDAELNQEFFDNVLGRDQAKTEEEYMQKLKELIANQLKNDSNYRFTIDAQEVLRSKVGEMELPDEFLKRFLVARDEKHDEKKVAEQYPETRKQLEWQLIKEQVAKQLNVDITEDDKLRLARFMAAQQFAQYGMSNLPDDVIDKYAKDLMERKEYKEEIANRAFEDKVYAALQGAVTLDEKSVSVDDFNKLFEQPAEK